MPEAIACSQSAAESKWTWTSMALDDPQDGIDEQRVAKQEVERAIRVGDARREPEAVAQRLSAAVQALVAVDGMILLDDGDEGRVAKVHFVADGRTIQRGVARPGDAHHVRVPSHL